MRRLLLPIFLLSSLAIALFCAVFLVRSLHREDLFIARTRFGMFAMGTYRGGVQLYIDAVKYQPASAVVVWADAPARPLPAPRHHSWYHPLGFALSNTSIDSRLHSYLRSPSVLGPRLDERQTLCLPFWALMLLFWTPPLVWLNRRARAEQRRRQGLCPGCGYDMQGALEKCPDCGRETNFEYQGAVDPPCALSPVPSTWGNAKADAAEG